MFLAFPFDFVGIIITYIKAAKELSFQRLLTFCDVLVKTMHKAFIALTVPLFDVAQSIYKAEIEASSEFIVIKHIKTNVSDHQYSI